MKLEEIETFIENYEKPTVSYFVGNKLYKSENGKYLGRINKDIPLSHSFGSICFTHTMPIFEMNDNRYLIFYETFEFEKHGWFNKDYTFVTTHISGIHVFPKNIIMEVIGNDWGGIDKLKKFINVDKTIEVI
jgi:hypothetical protein